MGAIAELRTGKRREHIQLLSSLLSQEMHIASGNGKSVAMLLKLKPKEYPSFHILWAFLNIKILMIPSRKLL